MLTTNFNEEDTYPLILIVDDDPSLRQALEEIFEFSGYAVLTAASANEGLHMLNDTDMKPSLIISDVLMNEMDGYQFYRTLYQQEEWRDIPFIFLSAKSKLRDDAERRGLKVQGYMSKPFIVEDLLSTVANLVQD